MREKAKTASKKTKRFRLPVISISWDKVTNNATFAGVIEAIIGAILMVLVSMFVLNKQNAAPIIVAPALTVEIVAPTPEFGDEGAAEITASRVMTGSPTPTSTPIPTPTWTPAPKPIPSSFPNVPENGLYGEAEIKGLKVLAAATPGSSEVYLTFVNPLSDTTFEGIVLTDERWFFVTDDLGNQYPPDPSSLGLKGHVTVGPSAHIFRTVGLETSIAQNVGKLRILLRHVTAKKQGKLYSDFLPDIVVVLKPRGEEP